MASDPAKNLSINLDKAGQSLINMAKASEANIDQMIKLGKQYNNIDQTINNLVLTLTRYGVSDKNAIKIVENLNKSLLKEQEQLKKNEEALKQLIIEQDDASRSAKDYEKWQSKLTKEAKERSEREKQLAKDLKLVEAKSKELAANALKESAIRDKARKSAQDHSDKLKILFHRLKDAGVNTRKFMEENRKLIKASRGSKVAMDQLNRSVARATKTVNRGVFGFRNLRNSVDGSGMSFSVIRSKLLLMNFALGMGIRQIGRFARESAKLDNMKVAFDSLSGGIGNASISLNQLTEATDGTMSDFDLLQQANNALILGVARSSQEMAEMFDIAQRLGAALGRDTATSVESLITGIGRQSRLMLDNIGIIVRVEDAYKKYANTNKKNVKQLTDFEKKQAFLNATMDAAREKASRLNKETQNSAHTFQQFDAAVERAANNIGKGLMPALESATRLSTSFLNAITPETVFSFANGIIAAGTAYAIMKVKSLGVVKNTLAFTASLWKSVTAMKAASFSLKGLNLLWKNTPIGKASLAIGIATTALFQLFQTSKKVEGSTKNLNVKYKEQFTVLDIVRERIQAVDMAWEATISAQNKNIDNLKTQLALLNATSEFEKQLIKIKHEVSDEERVLIQQIIDKKAELSEAEKKAAEDKAFQDSIRTKAEMWGMYNQAVSQTISAIDTMNNAEITQARDRELRSAEGIRSEDKRRKKIDEINKKYDALSEKRARDLHAWKIMSAVSNSALAFTQTISDPTIQPSWLKVPLAAMIAAQGLAQIKTIQAQKYEQGGLVGGRRHSQGGTMIEAEQGEFVMNRNAVDSIGADNLSRMNQGGGMVTVNVSGNLLTKDFVEDELAEAIKDAVRRGSDFGFS